MSSNGNISEVVQEGIITSHTISKLYDEKGVMLDLLHSDLFDSRRDVVISALDALGKRGKEASLKHLVKMFTSSDSEIKSGAVRCAGEIGGEKAKNILIDFFKSVQGEEIRCEILDALAKCAPKDPEVEALIKVFSSSQLISDKARARMIGLMIEVNDGIDIRPIINQAQPGSMGVTEIYKKAGEKEKLKSAVVEHATKTFARLNPSEKKLLVRAASPFNNQQAEKLLIELMMDIHPEVRRECYAVLGSDKKQVPVFGKIVEFLMDGVEDDPEIEEEARKAILRMEETGGKSIKLSSLIGNKIVEKIKDLFQKLKQGSSRLVSETHELGWLIVNSKEYLEYYGNEDFKHAIVSYLKGSGNYTMNDLMRELRATAVKVEVRHFDGYNALVEIIKNPKRPGSALIARELAIAKLGRRRDMYQLMRNLYLTRMFNMNDMEGMFIDIYRWARSQKLFRLAEAALYAIAKINSKIAMDAIRENITPPIMSKILAIASFRLIRYFGWLGFEESIVKLLEESTDQYVMLNMLDALLGASNPIKGKVVAAIVKRFSFETDEEIISKLSNLIEQANEPALVDNLINVYSLSNEDKKIMAFQTIRNILLNHDPLDRELLINFLYKVIKEDKERCKGYAAGILYLIRDDYSARVIKDIMEGAGIEGKISLFECLAGNMGKDIVPLFPGVFFIDDSPLHQSFRMAIEGLNSETGEALVQLSRDVRSKIGKEVSTEESKDVNEKDLKVTLLKEKEEYRFEKEHIKRLFVLFTDIVGYTKKSQELSSMELTELLKEYEGILIPILTKHNGNLVKRIGDGHLFVFDRAIDAVLGAIRLQKAINRFNNFREERLRVQIRVGIHGGEVVVKGKDVFGSTVNIASRLEESAEQGTIYISKVVYEEVKDYIHAREVGNIKLKGVEAPVFVYEPYEISVNLPNDMDPTKSFRNVGEDSATLKVEKEQVSPQKSIELEELQKRYGRFYDFTKNTLAVLNALCTRVENGQATVKEMKLEIAKRWKLIQKEFKV